MENYRVDGCSVDAVCQAKRAETWGRRVAPQHCCGAGCVHGGNARRRGGAEMGNRSAAALLRHGMP